MPGKHREAQGCLRSLVIMLACALGAWFAYEALTRGWLF